MKGEVAMNYIKLYSDEFTIDDWEYYCDICGVPYTSTVITITFKDENVSYE